MEVMREQVVLPAVSHYRSRFFNFYEGFMEIYIFVVP
jgi:hypothetical protein